MTYGKLEPGGTAVEIERLRRLFQIFAATQCRGRSLVYEKLSEEAVSDELLRLLLAAPRDQRRPSLLFAAVNLLVAGEPDDALASYYPTHGGGRPRDNQLPGAFRSFCDRHRDRLRDLLAQRSTQTNEIRRCVALRLGADHVQRHWPGPLALVEVGASAGLNLAFDRYHYRFADQHASDPASSSVVITCRVRGGSSNRLLFGPIPEITSRLGIDQQPIDLDDPDARAWLEAFIWPEQTEDLATLRAAVNLHRSTSAARVVAGNAAADTARQINSLPGTEPVVVFTASLLSYLDRSARNIFVEQLDQAASCRPVAWVFAEGPGLLATTGVASALLNGPLAKRNSLYLTGVSLRGPDRHDDALLGLADPYLRWIAPARNATDDFGWLTTEGATR